MKQIMGHANRLDSLDKTEFFDVARRLKPGLTWAEYEVMWDEFQREKAEHFRKLALS